MTDLTKDWKDGKLPSGWYWVECCRDKGIYAYTGEYLNNMYRPRNSERIIEKVPSYDEWQASENYIDYLKQCISVYESKDKQATETSIAYNELLEENTKLKELLKEYKKQLSEIKNAYIDLTTQDEYGSYYIDEAKLFVEIVGKIIKDFDEHKIYNAIGENKWHI